MELILGVLLILGLLGKSLSVEYSRGIETCNDTRPFSWEDYFEVANGMNSALEFFAEDILNINLDGVLGVRMAEAALKHSIPQLETMRQEDPTNKKLRRALKRASVLHRKTQEIATNGVYQVQKTDPEYYRRLAPFLAPNFWKFNFPSRKLDLTLSTRMKNGKIIDNLSEAESDKYFFLRLIAKSIDDFEMQLPGYHPLKCMAEPFSQGRIFCESITDTCFMAMNRPNTKGYTLTHQAIYIWENLGNGCHETMENLAYERYQTTTDVMIQSYCSDIYQELRLAFSRGCVPIKLQDLALEQIGVCGALGFRDFFRPEFIRQIPLMQRDIGCFGNAPEDYPGYHKTVPHGPNYRAGSDASPKRPPQPSPTMSQLPQMPFTDPDSDFGFETRSPEERKYLREYFTKFVRKGFDADVERIRRLGDTASRRVKRADMVMNYDCLSHKTSLGIASYALSLRYIAEDLHSHRSY